MGDLDEALTRRCSWTSGPVPDGEAIIEIIEDVLRFYQRRDQEGDH